MEQPPPKLQNDELTGKANVEAEHVQTDARQQDIKETDQDTSEGASTNGVTFKVTHQESSESACDSGTSSMSLLQGQVASEGHEVGFDMIDYADGPESEASKIFRDHYFRLSEAMVNEIDTCANHLFSKRLIDHPVLVFATNTDLDSSRRVGKVLQYQIQQIKQRGDNALLDFVDVLKCCSQCIAGIGIEMSDALIQRCNIADTPPNGNSNCNPNIRPQVHTQASAPPSIGHGNHREDYSSFYQKKYGSFPGANGGVFSEEFDSARPHRTASVCSTGEEDLITLTDNLTNELQRISQRHEKRITRVLKEKEELQKELEFVKLKNQHLNLDLLQFRKCKAELEEYKKLAATQSANDCKRCREKDKLLEIERMEYQARLDNLNSQIDILLQKDSTTS